MDLARRPLALALSPLFLGMSMTAWLAEPSIAQTVGPGTQTTPVNVSSGTTTIVGNTTVDVRGTGTPTTTNATNVTGGTLIVDMTAGASPGGITLYTDNGNALYANGGAIQVPRGVNAVTTGGSALFANGAASSIQVTAGNVTVLGRGFSAATTGGAITLSSSAFNDPNRSADAKGNGFAADAGGTINVQGGNRLFTNGYTNLVGLGASNAGSSINVTGNLPVTMGGLGAMGIYLYNGGQLTATAPISLTFNNTSSIGLTVDRTSMASPVSRLSATFNVTSGVGGTGVAVMNNGSALLDSLTVTGPAAAIGVWVRNGSSATLTGNSRLDINSATNGQSYTLSTGSLVNNPIFSTGTGISYRAGLINLGGQISSTGTTINANAAGSYGSYAGQHGTVQSTTTLANNTINATGAGSFGLMGYANSNYVVTGSTINSSGYVALYAWGYANPANNQVTAYPTTMSFTDTQINATGGADGLWSINQTKGLFTNAITFNGGSLTSDDYAIAGVGPSTITASNGATISGGTWLLDAEGANPATGDAPTLINLTATGGSALSGLVEADSASVANVTLADRSSWIGKAFYATNVTVDDTSQWTIPASSVVFDTVTNNGLVTFTPPDNGQYKALYVRSYTGVGTLGIHTFLGDDASPTDRLIIDGGTATGSSRIAVTNMDGPGALTTADGILVVQTTNGGTTAAEAFALSAPVVAGPYEYVLRRGGVSDGTENNWFLRSALPCQDASTPGCAPAPEPPPPPAPPEPPPPPPAPPAPPPPDPVNPPAPTPTPPAPPVPDPVVPDENGPPAPVPVAPIYRPEVSLYTALPGMALRYGWATLDNLHERVGEEEQLRHRGDLREDSYLNALWVRVLGEDGNVRGASQGIYNGSPQYDYNIEAIQAGLDVYAQEHDNQQRDHAGLYLGTGRIRSDVTNYDGTDAGDDIVKGQSLGLYWTHFWSEGQYLDTVWQGTWSKYSAKSDDGLALHHSGFGWAASLEGGYPFHDDTQVWEPQAQVIYQRFNDGTAGDAAASVRFSDITSLVGRLGLRWADTWTLEPPAQGAPRLFTGWLRFNVWKEFKGRPITSFSSDDGFVPFDGNIKGSWWQLNGGMTWELDKNTSFYANLGYQKGFGSRGFHAWDAKAGFRWNW